METDCLTSHAINAICCICCVLYTVSRIESKDHYGDDIIGGYSAKAVTNRSSKSQPVIIGNKEKLAKTLTLLKSSTSRLL